MAQVNFFMTKADESDFLDSLFSRADTHVYAGRFFASRDPIPLSSKKQVGKTVDLTLVNKSIIAQPRALTRGGAEFAGRFTFDLFRIPVIEFTRSRFSKRRLISGRIFAKPDWLKSEEANVVSKSWYGSIGRSLKKEYRLVNKIWRFGPDAWNWSMSGGVCCFGDESAFAASLRDVDPKWIESPD